LELQVTVVDDEGAPPPTRASASEGARLATPRRSVPSKLTPIVGRQADLETVRRLLVAEPLVTLVGAPGIGKTRLAQEVLAIESAESSKAVAWVPLQPIADVRHVPAAIAVALGLSLPGENEGFDSLARALQGYEVLLALDGAEHLSALPNALSTLLYYAPELRLLVTSQTPLGIDGERVHRLAMLSVPRADAPLDAIREHAAVQLFCDRVTAGDNSFRLCSSNEVQVAEICRRLDGNPLALELAAARAPALGVSTLLERIDGRFRLLKRQGIADDPRHSTLHAALDWSFNLLSEAEKHVFTTLSVFPGSFSLDVAARCVADDSTDVADGIDLIARLVDRSLLTSLASEPPRYSLLETARQYALAKLTESQEIARARQRLAAAMLIHMDAAYTDYWSMDEAIWLARYEPDLANVRAAIDWASEHDAAIGVALYGSVWPLFVETDLETEGRTRFDQIVGLLSDQLPNTRVARFWEAVASYESGFHFDRARYAAELAAKFHSRAGNARALYYAQMLLALNSQGDPHAAQHAYDTAAALEDPAWPVRLLALGAKTEGTLAMTAGRFGDARAAYARSVRHALAASEHEALASTICIVELDIASGDLAGALQLARPLVQSLRHSGRRDTAIELMGLAFTALVLNGDLEEARTLGSEIVHVGERTSPGKLRLLLDAMACLALLEGNTTGARQLSALAEETRIAHGELSRRPALVRAREIVVEKMRDALGEGWQTSCSVKGRLDVASACRSALGIER
jgi:predicted ATPase